jgi:UDPglucose 6-dehydrogenase
LRVGFVGCGKLGLMVALTIESRGHEVRGYDVRPEPAEYLAMRRIPFQEAHSAELLANTRMQMCDLHELCAWADIIFLAPQTPHGHEYEGVTPLPESRADFDYSYLKEAVQSVDACLTEPKTCVIISTVLPGTIQRHILPLIGENFRLVYSPQFIAMGTVYDDFLNPEFWLIGTNDTDLALGLGVFYRTIQPQDGAKFIITDIRTAEGVKVFYNTFITTKTVLANLYGELSERLGMNVDDIFRALTLSNRRLLSSKYLKAGMGDGGGCHPRDNIALSYLARREGMAFDFFDALMTAREKHCSWLADIIEQEQRFQRLPIVILGRAFKPETNIETGSPALLLSEILTQRGIAHECVEDFGAHPSRHAHLFFIGCQHERYQHYKFPVGSVVIDPFRYIPDKQGVDVIRLGEGQKAASRPMHEALAAAAR